MFDTRRSSYSADDISKLRKGFPIDDPIDERRGLVVCACGPNQSSSNYGIIPALVSLHSPVNVILMSTSRAIGIRNQRHIHRLQEPPPGYSFMQLLLMSTSTPLHSHYSCMLLPSNASPLGVFSWLPPELRTMIWKLLFPESRPQNDFLTTRKPLAILRTSREVSAEITIKLYSGRVMTFWNAPKSELASHPSKIGN